MDAPVTGYIKPENALHLFITFATLYFLYHAIQTIYIAYFGPLSSFPGPKLRALSRLPRIITLVKGTEPIDFPALHKQYGPIVRIAPDELSINTGASGWKDLHGFKKPGQSPVFKDPFFYGKPFNGVDSLITANDANHTRQRKLVSHAFADKSLRDLEPMLKQWAGTMRTKLGEKAAAGESVDMLKYYNSTTFDIMGDLSFNEGLNMLEDGEYSPWVKAIFLGIKNASFLRAIKLSSSFGKYLVEQWLFKSQKVRVKQAQHWNYTKERVNRRLARTPERADLWRKILEKSNGPDGLTTDEHHSLGALFMVAGTETTATALSGVTYYLLRNPQYLKKLTQEIRESHANFDDITLESVQRLKYLHAVLQEGLRCYPPVPTGLNRRVPKGGATVSGTFIPEDTTMSIHQFSTYRSEEHFKNPYEFHPERWLGDPEYKDDHLDAMEPFSVGPRNCIGKNLAWHEMRLLLCTALLSFDLELCEESWDWKDQKIYILWEKKPLMCKLTPAKR
ncbi:hypothetical protein PRZ48_001215 [Zasmidium cellare]|uniref:Cytochrome P450 n=1 Tax=Zasmidium cellare TaxID=395010 RepID=A0ABR0F2G9_ZASCE|nr:hypothetical protein PRZ48_001215 [Zasmidium cellare]